VDEATHFLYSGEVNDKKYELTIPRHKDISDYSDGQLHRKLSNENPHLEPHEVTAIVKSGGEDESEVNVEHKGKKYTHRVINNQAPRRIYNEEFEQIDELNKSTLASYVNKAAHQVRAKSGIAASFETQGERKRDPERKASYMSLAKDYRKGARKRLTGIEKATAKLTREEVE
jgi:hypothetical protein